MADASDQRTLQYEPTPPGIRSSGPGAVSILVRTAVGVWVAVWVIVFVILLICVAAALVFFLFTFDLTFLLLATTLICLIGIAFLFWYYGALLFRVVSEMSR